MFSFPGFCKQIFAFFKMLSLFKKSFTFNCGALEIAFSTISKSEFSFSHFSNVSKLILGLTIPTRTIICGISIPFLIDTFSATS